ncbi:hypothetical protein P9A10_25155, partial [Serratia marcescens]|uniref:hypothetical protein n=1 Tax=Serratia marcescens TaxID=615 RepID=UPI003204B241
PLALIFIQKVQAHSTHPKVSKALPRRSKQLSATTKSMIGIMFNPVRVFFIDRQQPLRKKNGAAGAVSLF